MKLFHKYLLPAAALFLCAGLAACSEDTTDPANPYSGNFTLKTQAEVDAFPARPTANSITIEGADITDISSLDVPAVGTLLIRNTGIGTLALPNTTSIATRFEVSGNESLTAVGDLGVKFVIGDIYVEDNPLLTDIIREIMGPEVALVNAGAESVHTLHDALARRQLLAPEGTGQALLCTSDRPEGFGQMARRFLQEEPTAPVRLVDIERY